MPAVLGTMTIDCPTCRRTIELPVIISSSDTIAGIEIDPDALAAHWLTHDMHDGEPRAA